MSQKERPALSRARAGVPPLPALKLIDHNLTQDIYELDNNRVLIVTHDALDLHGFSLNALFPGVGAVRTAMAVDSLRRIDAEFESIDREQQKHAKDADVSAVKTIGTALVKAGADVDPFLPQDERGNTYWHNRCMVMRRLKEMKTFSVSGYLSGHTLESYHENGTVCGHPPAIELQEGDCILPLLDVRACTVEYGRETFQSANVTSLLYPEQTAWARQLYRFAHAEVLKRGGILARAQFTFGRGKYSNKLYLAGDPVTLGSSAVFWCARAWRAGCGAPMRAALPAQGIQPLLDWGAAVGIDTYDPTCAKDIARVHDLAVPEQLCAGIAQGYHDAVKVQRGVPVAA